MAAKYVFTTLGCKVNQYESQQLREVLNSLGMERATRGELADLAVVNTCAVTATACGKNRRAIRRLARGGKTPVVVVGCGAGAEPDALRRLPGVQAVLGHECDARAELRHLVTNTLKLAPVSTMESHGGFEPSRGFAPQTQVDLGGYLELNVLPAIARADKPHANPKNNRIRKRSLTLTNEALVSRIERFEGHQRAFLKVQDGCDAFCSYCIIPRLRPALRSKPVDVAVAEARTLVANGHKEIIVTGIFLGAYGQETAIRKRFPTRRPLAELIASLARVEGLVRLRLSSLEPGDVTDELLEILGTNANCVPHLHLPMQSGSPTILRRMNRQYTRDDFLAMIERVWSALEAPAVTTDIIVGFPGESEQDFAQSLEIARHVGFLKIHSFPFSPRDGTAAARWSAEFVPNAALRERMSRLAAVESECSLAFRNTRVGNIERVIVESGICEDENDGAEPDTEGLVFGRTDRYYPVWFEANGKRPGDLANVRIERVTPGRTHGVLLSAK